MYSNLRHTELNQCSFYLQYESYLHKHPKTRETTPSTKSTRSTRRRTRRSLLIAQLSPRNFPPHTECSDIFAKLSVKLRATDSIAQPTLMLAFCFLRHAAVGVAWKALEHRHTDYRGRGQEGVRDDFWYIALLKQWGTYD